MVPSQPDVAGDGVLAHTDKSAGLADAAALGDMGEEGGTLSSAKWESNRGVPFRSENRALQDLRVRPAKTLLVVVVSLVVFRNLKESA